MEPRNGTGPAGLVAGAPGDPLNATALPRATQRDVVSLA